MSGGVIERSTLSIGENAKLEVASEFTIGPGTHLSISSGGHLSISGKANESASGITCRTRIMVEQDVRIRKDCIFAWGCVISDSDWHVISGRPGCVPVRIGDNVWISHDFSVVKGATIPHGCIVASKISCRQQAISGLLPAGGPAGSR